MSIAAVLLSPWSGSVRRSGSNPRSQRSAGRQRWRSLGALAGGLAIALHSLALPALADPFRTVSPRNIDRNAEAAFLAMFAEGDYVQAAKLLEDASRNEPLAHALAASLAYLDQDWDTLRDRASLTRRSAERLIQRDPLRGNIYLAVGHFLEGGYTLSTQSTVAATPTIIRELQRAFSALGEAEKVAPDDPELNLVKGYIELFLATNLPFSSPEQALEKLQTYAGPEYLAQRGIAIGYRDLEQFDPALAAVDQALAETPNNPDLYYLKAQILVRQEKHRESLDFFKLALEKEAQLPQRLANQIAWEECRAQGVVEGLRDGVSRQRCNPLLRRR
ncbi:MAG: Sll0314/Alr1548 family TPR repeat-containing protein [Cyanobacteria bacterium J069]|nr:MAG: hypothetical protein D6742_02865 [Cyanobacteria bacterium J069]